MKLAIGADHAGFALKQELREHLLRAGHEVEDLGTNSPESTDYPDYAQAVAARVAAGNAERGILVCSSGVGMSIAANKVHGIRAALGTSPEEVHFTRAHNDANVLTIGANFSTSQNAHAMVDTFLATAFEGGRHQRRVDKMMALERQEDSQ